MSAKHNTKIFSVASVIFVSTIETIFYCSACKTKGFTKLILTEVWKHGSILIQTSEMTRNSEWIQGKMQLLYLPRQTLRNQQYLDRERPWVAKF